MWLPYLFSAIVYLTDSPKFSIWFDIQPDSQGRSANKICTILWLQNIFTILWYDILKIIYLCHLLGTVDHIFSVIEKVWFWHSYNTMVSSWWVVCAPHWDTRVVLPAKSHSANQHSADAACAQNSSVFVARAIRVFKCVLVAFWRQISKIYSYVRKMNINNCTLLQILKFIWFHLVINI